MTKYASHYARKYAATFNNPTLARMAQCKDDFEWVERPGFDYGPEFWKLMQLYHTAAWTDTRGVGHYIIDKNRMKELESAYAAYAAEQLAKKVEQG